TTCVRIASLLSIPTFSPYLLLHPFLFFFSSRHSSHPVLHSFPTRRSSDLFQPLARAPVACALKAGATMPCSSAAALRAWSDRREIGRAHAELQSLRHLVCRLLLEKKKKKIKKNSIQ